MDADLLLCRPIRPGDLAAMGGTHGTTAGFIASGVTYTRSKALADLIDSGGKVPADWHNKPELAVGWPGEDWKG